MGYPFVLYSGMVKQYSVDVAVTLALLYLFLRVVDQPRFGARSALILTFAGAAAVWLSHPAAFVLAGMGAGAIAVMLAHRNRRGLVALSIPFSAWLASFGAMFVLTLRDEFRDLAQATTWYTGMQGTPHRNLYAMFRDSNLRLLHWAADGIAPIVALIGAVSMWATPRHRPRLVAGAVMLVATLGAGYLGKYPVGQRFILFLLPLALLCLAEGVVRLIGALPRDLAATFALAVAAVVVPPLDGAARDLVRPRKSEDVKPVLAYLGDRWQAGDALYVSNGAQYALRYYLECSDCRGLPPQLRAALDVRPHSGASQHTPALVSLTPKVVIGREQADASFGIGQA